MNSSGIRSSRSINSISINRSNNTKQVGAAAGMTNIDMLAMAKVVTKTTVKHCDHGNGRGVMVETQEEELEEETGHDSSSSCSSSRSSLHNGRHSNHICGSRERLCCTPEARAGDVAFESHGHGVVERAAQGEVGRAAQCGGKQGEQLTLVVKATPCSPTRAAPAEEGGRIKTNGATHRAPHCATKTEVVPTGANGALSGEEEVEGGTAGQNQPLSLSLKDIEAAAPRDGAMRAGTKTVGAAQGKGAAHGRNGADIITEIGGLTYTSLQPGRKPPAPDATTTTESSSREITRPICKIADTYSLSTATGTSIDTTYPQSINMIGQGRDIDPQSIDRIPAASINSDQHSAKGIINTAATNGAYSRVLIKGTHSDPEVAHSGVKPVKALEVDSEAVKDLSVIRAGGTGHTTQSPSANTTATSSGKEVHSVGVKGTPPPAPDTHMVTHHPPDGATSLLQGPAGSIPDRHHPQPTPAPPPGRGESSDQSGRGAGGGGTADVCVSERVNAALGGGGGGGSSRRTAAAGGSRGQHAAGNTQEEEGQEEVVNVRTMMLQPPSAMGGVSGVSSGVRKREAAQRNLDSILQRIMTQGKRHVGGGGRDSSSPDLHLPAARGHPSDYMGPPPGACMDVPHSVHVWGGEGGCTKLPDPSLYPAHNPAWIYGMSGGGFIPHTFNNNGLPPSQHGTEEVLDYSLNGRHSQTNGNSLKGAGKPTKVTPSDGIATAHARRKRAGSGSSTERRGGGKKARGGRGRGRVGGSTSSSGGGGGVKQSVNSSGCNLTPDPIPPPPPADTHPALPAGPLHTPPTHADSRRLNAGENSAPPSGSPSGDSAEVPAGAAGWQHFASRLERINRLKEDLRQKEREVALIRKARQDPGLNGH